MAFKHKFSYGFREICNRYNFNHGSLKSWKKLYETFGWNGLKTSFKGSHYSKEINRLYFYTDKHK